VENKMKKFNLAAAGLERVKDAWEALHSEQKEEAENVALLVNETEQALQTEQAGWVLQMQKSLSDLSPQARGRSSQILAGQPGKE
jgi:hypothetical protein